MNKKLVVFDMDGTIYLGKDLFDGALDVFSWLKNNNIDYLFFTNNSSHDLEFYHKKMLNFGLDCSLEHDFYSSTEVTISYLKDLGVTKIVCGKDTSFGYKNEGTISDLEKEFEVTVIDDLYIDNMKVSSSNVKSLLEEGKVKQANKLLGRNCSSRH